MRLMPRRVPIVACRISELVIDCRDPQRLAAFWCEVLGFIMLDTDDDGAVEIGPREGFGGLQPTLVFSPTTEPKAGKLRLHIDVNATDRDQDAELERLLKLGARPGRHRPDRRGALALPGRPRRQRILPPASPPELSIGPHRQTPKQHPQRGL